MTKLNQIPQLLFFTQLKKCGAAGYTTEPIDKIFFIIFINFFSKTNTMTNFNFLTFSSLLIFFFPILITLSHGRILPSKFSTIDTEAATSASGLELIEPLPLASPLSTGNDQGGHGRVKRGAAYPGGHGDFSGVAKQSTFAALGSYGGYLGHGKGSTAGGYGAGSGRNGLDAAGGITIAGALGSYGGYLGHKGPTVISSGGFGNGGLLFGKI